MVIFFKSCIIVILNVLLINVFGRFRTRSTHISGLLFLLNIPFLAASFEMDLNTQCAVFSATNVTHNSLGPFNDLYWFGLRVFRFAHLQVLGQTLRVKCSWTVGTFLKSLVVTVEGTIIIPLDLVDCPTAFGNFNKPVEVNWSLRTRPPLINRFLVLLDLPFLLASLEMNL